MEVKVVRKGAELKRIGAKAFMSFINPIIRERAYILREKKVDVREERAWLEAKAKDVDSGGALMILLLDEGKLAGTCEVWRGKHKERHNVKFGLSVAKEYRGKGYGEVLLRKGIELAKKYFRPHRIWIEHIEGNDAARGLYEKVGFRETARLKEYVNHFGEWKDKVMMEYSHV